MYRRTAACRAETSWSISVSVLSGEKLTRIAPVTTSSESPRALRTRLPAPFAQADPLETQMPFAESQLTVFALGTPGRESVRMAEESPQSTTACGTALACSSVLKALPPLTAYDREIADQTVSEIRLKENGKIRIITLINGQEIGKETAA